MKIKFLIMFFIVGASYSYGQEKKLSETITGIAEELSENESDPEGAALFVDRLQDLADNPVKINSADEDEISRLFFLSDFQVKALADYIHTSGKIVSAFEIANLPGFDRETTEMIIPFITLELNTGFNSGTHVFRSSLITNLTFTSGNRDTSSSGSPVKILSKYRFTSGAFSGGLTIEKDAGEKFLSGTPLRPDFFSANLSYNGNGLIKRIIIGDFSARFGQGTNINTGMRTALSLTAPGFMSARNEIKPYTSTDENNFFRGAAGEFAIKNLELSLFYSYSTPDATVVSDQSSTFIENFYTAGLHNTQALLLKKDAVSDLSYGLNLSYNLRNIRIGMVFSDEKFSMPVLQSGNAPADLYRFSGDRNYVGTIYYTSHIKRIVLYGEISSDKSGDYAIVQGLSLRPSDRITINFLYRKYDPGFATFHGKGPGGTSSTSNEQGLIGNFTFEAAKHLFISGGADIQNFGWLKYRNSAPSRGIKEELKARFMPSENWVFESVFAYSLKMYDDQATAGIPGQNEIITKSFRCSAKYYIADNITLTSRADFKNCSSSRSRGMLLLQDLNYRLQRIPLTLWLRYCIFKTSDWDSRLYTYENDLLYSFSVPALSGEGNRSYLMFKYTLKDFGEVRFKYGTTSLIKQGIGSENRDEFKLQIKILF